MPTSELGVIEEIEDSREIWSDEERDFTPWLCEEIDILKDILEIDIEDVEMEKNVGGYTADIVAEDINGGKIVIENQLTETDHRHLGQLLTYAAGLDVHTMVWITNKAKEEHKEAIDWLNRKSGKDTNFFLLEIEVLRIDDSAPAPRFNIVSEPLEWEPIKEEELSETQRLRLSFWRSFKEYCNEKGVPFNCRKPKDNHWYSFSIGKSHFHCNWIIRKREKSVGCKFIITRDDAEKIFEEIKENKEEIEERVGHELEWNKGEDMKRSTIDLWADYDYTVKDDWDEIFEWMKENGKRFYRVFKDEVNKLDLD